MPRMAAGLCRGASGLRSWMALTTSGVMRQLSLNFSRRGPRGADGVDLGNAVDDLALAGGHLLHDLGECLGVGGEDGGRGCLMAVGLMGDHAAFHADAFAQTFTENLFALHIDQLVLQAGRTAVDNQNFMEYPP